MKRRVTAAERIAFLTGQDFADMKDCRYQPTRYKVAVYVLGNDYYCSPAGKALPDVGYPWEEIGEYKDQKVYRATPTSSSE
jgi:hypothetical protein